jgi:hypothetical protein
MPNQFADIKIVAMDDAASGPSGEGALLRLVLKLSQSAPTAWSQYFNESWRQHIYMMKRKASVSGDRLEIICMPDELESDHLPELKKIVGDTNEAYRKFAQERERRKEIEIETARRQSEALFNLKGRLKFD